MAKTLTVTAGAFKRFLAFIIDVILLQLITSPIANAIDIDFNALMQGEFTPTESFVWISLALSLVWMLYFTLFEYYLSATPGMRLLRLQVQTQASLAAVLTRNLFALLFFPFSMLWIIEPFMVLFKQRRLLEMLSRTETVELVRT